MTYRPVSFEVGYLFAMRKPVCLLKDATLKTLQTDLVSKLYRPFDFQGPVGTSVVQGVPFRLVPAHVAITIPPPTPI